MVKILGIETSCDETSVAIVNSDRTILAHKTLSQIKEHAPFKGVVPEIAARSHINHLHNLINESVREAKLESFNNLDGIAVTAGPGLIGGVIVGVMTAKAIAAYLNKPFIAVNHLEGHALTVRLIEHVKFPYLLLLLSGGHCQILIVHNVGEYELLGQTLDDALGEAYDKVAKMMNLGYPGGPIIEKLALTGDENRFDLPVPLKDRKDCSLSFSGLKTAVKQKIDSFEKLEENDIADICASFQHIATKSICMKLENALQLIQAKELDIENCVLAGGVAANKYIRSKLENLLAKYNMNLKAPPIKLCTDNAAMIAWAGIENMKLGRVNSLDFAPKARWPLESLDKKLV